MGAIAAIALDVGALELALASFDGASLSLLAATAAALGLWLWGRERLRHSARPVPARAAAFAAPTRSADVVPPTRTQARPRRPDPAASSSLLRAPPGPADAPGPTGARTPFTPGTPLPPVPLTSRPTPRREPPDFARTVGPR